MELLVTKKKLTHLVSSNLRFHFFVVFQLFRKWFSRIQTLPKSKYRPKRFRDHPILFFFSQTALSRTSSNVITLSTVSSENEIVPRRPQRAIHAFAVNIRSTDEEDAVRRDLTNVLPYVFPNVFRSRTSHRDSDGALAPPTMALRFIKFNFSQIFTTGFY